MKNELDLTRGWFKKGDSDLSASERITSSDGPYDTACFHVQQAIEKYLKAFLAFHKQPIPRTHDLEELETLCAGIQPIPELTVLHLDDLTDYAVQLRYDFEAWPEQETAKDAIEIARQVRAIMLKLLPDLDQKSETDREQKKSS